MKDTKKKPERFRCTAIDIKMKSMQTFLQSGQTIKEKPLLFCHEGILDKLLTACEISFFLPLREKTSCLSMSLRQAFGK